ncbi:MAG: sigma 54-interacting transcriptional regulator [Syntrophomonas sp.]
MAIFQTFPNSFIKVENLINTDFQPLRPEDTLRTVLNKYKETKVETLPVIDGEGKLLGVLPRGRLYKAILDNESLDRPCRCYMVASPYALSSDLSYNELTFIARVNQSKVGTVPVIDKDNKLVGVSGKLEYVRETLNLTSKAKAHLESIFRAMNEGVIATDEKGQIVHINLAAEKLFGINAGDVIGQHFTDVFPELIFDCTRPLRIKHTVRSVPVIINQVPIIENDTTTGMNYAFLDLSDLENIAAELEFVKKLQANLQGVLSASSDGLIVTDQVGLIKSYNEGVVSLLKNPPKTLIDQPIEIILGNRNSVNVAKTGLPEVEVCLINGRNCMVSHIPIDRDKVTGLPLGVVSTVYLDDNRVTDQMARKWFSLQQQVQYYRGELEKQGAAGDAAFNRIVTENPYFISLKKEMNRVACSTSTVLITGESGVGKDMFARALHGASKRSRRPFVKVNCAAIPETLLESELFGYEPGSFTGALKKGKPGYFEQAHEGTIFLDEIGEMPLSIQVKVLQVLQEKQFMRVGGTSTQTVDVRIIAATNRDLREAMAKGEFREDLYYRLNVIEFHLPPLRSRSEDILPLAEIFIEKYNNILGTYVTGLTTEAREALTAYSWPGNIRELENAIERAANYVWEGEINTDHLPAHIFENIQTNKVEPDLRSLSSLEDVEKDIILDALKTTEGNKSAAARLLKISRSSFYEKLSKHGIS